ncbi:Gex-3-interacting protein 13 [Toxocara canis]|uniref:Gex-3-interacting protein 13 n=1 Tax=Toxocara canis TaxID=6265 RepID=A0A0B2V1F4_TOXCA|nr:Gex-3-interacting protein 13 [Toxocara canis]
MISAENPLGNSYSNLKQEDNCNDDEDDRCVFISGKGTPKKDTPSEGSCENNMEDVLGTTNGASRLEEGSAASRLEEQIRQIAERARLAQAASYKQSQQQTAVASATKNDTAVGNAFLEALLKQEENYRFDLSNQPKFATDAVEPAPKKKKRQRRNPVWPYFDVNDGVASCKQCSYNTTSVFSTNLKVHLRTHHNATYKLVIEAEEQQHAALQKSLISSPSNPTISGSNPFMHRVTTTALPSVPLNSVSTSGNCGDLSLGQILSRVNTSESRSATSSGPATPISSIGDADNVFDTASTSDYDLTYSTLLNGGRIDEGCLPALNQSTSASKRRRVRRHPVWRFFKDVDGTKSVGCVKCSFSTASPFSTNLKMHLKAHHKDDYTLVLRLEAQQREEEGLRGGSFTATKRKWSWDEGGTISSNDANRQLGGLLNKATAQVLLKKNINLFDTDEDSLMSMSTSDRLAAMVELAAASSVPDDTTKQDIKSAKVDTLITSSSSPALLNSSVGSSTGLDAMQADLLARFGLSGSDLLQSSPLLQKDNILGGHAINTPSAVRSQSTTQSLLGQTITPATPTHNVDNTKSVRTVSKKLPTGEIVKVRMMRKDVGMSSEFAPVAPNAKPEPPSTSEASLFDPAANMTPVSVAEPPVAQLATATEKNILKPLESRVARDESLARFMDKSKAFHLLGMPEFKKFVQTLAPDYQLPSSGSLKRLAETLK